MKYVTLFCIWKKSEWLLLKSQHYSFYLIQCLTISYTNYISQLRFITFFPSHNINSWTIWVWCIFSSKINLHINKRLVYKTYFKSKSKQSNSIKWNEHELTKRLCWKIEVSIENISEEIKKGKHLSGEGLVEKINKTIWK